MALLTSGFLSTWKAICSALPLHILPLLQLAPVAIDEELGESRLLRQEPDLLLGAGAEEISLIPGVF